MTRRGKFITLEGPEGGGKSTHARALVARLLADGCPVVAARDPGGTSAGEVIRGLLQARAVAEPLAAETELLLFLASRAQLVAHVIRPALAQGRHVVCDRFADSTSAYQGFGRGLGLERVLALNEQATGGLVPDLTLLLDLPVAAGFERLRTRLAGPGGGPDRIESEDRAFHERVRAGFLELARRWPERIRRVDTSGDFAGVHEEIWRLTRGVLDA